MREQWHQTLRYQIDLVLAAPMPLNSRHACQYSAQVYSQLPKATGLIQVYDNLAQLRSQELQMEPLELELVCLRLTLVWEV